MPQCPRLPPPAGAGFPRNSRTHTTAPTGGKGEGQSERPAGRLRGTSARRSRPAPPGTPALGTTKAGAEETAGPGRAAASPRPRRQLTVNLLRHQRVGKGVPEDLSDLRRETRPSGPDPTRPRQARPPRVTRQPRPPPPPTSSSFLTLPVTNTTLRRAGAAILTPAPARSAANHRRRRHGAQQRPANGGRLPPVRKGGRLPPGPREGAGRSPVRGAVSQSLARAAAAAAARWAGAGRHGGWGRAHPSGPCPPPQARPAAGTGTSSGAGAAASLFTSSAFGSRGRRSPLPLFPEVESRLAEGMGQGTVLQALLRFTSRPLARLCTF